MRKALIVELNKRICLRNQFFHRCPIRNIARNKKKSFMPMGQIQLFCRTEHPLRFSASQLRFGNFHFTKFNSHGSKRSFHAQSTIRRAANRLKCSSRSAVHRAGRKNFFRTIFLADSDFFSLDYFPNEKAFHKTINRFNAFHLCRAKRQTIRNFLRRNVRQIHKIRKPVKGNEHGFNLAIKKQMIRRGKFPIINFFVFYHR